MEPNGEGAMNISVTTATGDMQANLFRDRMEANATRTSDFLKSLAHPQRLMILCHLVDSDLNVGQVEALVGLPQALVSKQLAKLRAAGLVTTRRDGRTVVYSITHDHTRRILTALYAEFCTDEC